MKKPIVAGNWKMYKTPSEGHDFVQKILNLVLEIEKTHVIFCPPFPALFNMVESMPSSFSVGAQNCHWEKEGAYTGEVSTAMLSDCGVEYVIVGHSERRHVFGEPDEWINRKVLAVKEARLIPILCVGETLEEREDGLTKDVLIRQLTNGLKGVDSLSGLVLAYEPVWAIGTGKTATPEQAVEAHQMVRKYLMELYPHQEAEAVSMLYGGSVKPANAAELINSEGVDGFLIGGASLNVESFTSIIKQVEQES